MPERSEIISNILALAMIAATAALLRYAGPPVPEPQPMPGKPVEVSLAEPEPERTKEEPQPQQAKPQEQPTSGLPPAQEEPNKPVAPPPPPPQEPSKTVQPPEAPPPPPPQEPSKTTEPPEPPKSDAPPKDTEPLQDPDGEAASRALGRQAAVEKEASAFKTCLQRKARYPSSKVSGKQKPHGTVVVNVSINGGNIVGIEIVRSSGSSILDEAAKASILTSGCGPLVNSGTISGGFVY